MNLITFSCLHFIHSDVVYGSWADMGVLCQLGCAKPPIHAYLISTCKKKMSGL